MTLAERGGENGESWRVAVFCFGIFSNDCQDGLLRDEDASKLQAAVRVHIIGKLDGSVSVFLSDSPPTH